MNFSDFFVHMNGISPEDRLDLLLQLLLYRHISKQAEFQHQEIHSLEEIAEPFDSAFLCSDSIIEMIEELQIAGIDTRWCDALQSLFDTNIFAKYQNNSGIKSIVQCACQIDLAKLDVYDMIDEYAKHGAIRNSLFTPPMPVCKLASRLATLDATPQSIADQLCGMGMLACQTGTLIGNGCNYYLQDKNALCVRLVQTCLLLSDVDINCISASIGDYLTIDSYEKKKFDCQVAVPPFAMRYLGDSYDTLLNDTRFSQYGILPPKSNTEMLCLEHVISHMEEQSGVAVVICPQSVLIGSERLSPIWDTILSKNILDGIVKIPAGTFYDMSIPTFLLLLKNGKTKQDVFLVDASSYFKGDRIKTIDDSGIDQLIALYRSRRNKNHVAYDAGKKEIIDNHYRLLPDSYLALKQLEKLLKKDSLVKLSEVASILKPHLITNGREDVSIITAAACTYPFDYEALRTGPETNVKLQKGDIILKGQLLQNVYLVAEDINNVYARHTDLVLRPTNMSPEYIYHFLRSDTGKLVLQVECVPIWPGLRLTPKAAENISLPLPKKSNDWYVSQFRVESNLHLSLEQYNHLLAHKDEFLNEEATEDILNLELIGKVKKHKMSALQELIISDTRELNSCFKAKAYKATLILAGSILEAVLIDWLSEIDGKDYFDQKLYVYDSRTGRDREAGLADYINQIDRLTPPVWMVGVASKAHDIRKKRNLVHAKLGIVTDETNEHTCRMVIDYLKTVLKTRGIENL